VTSAPHQQSARALRETLALYEEKRDLVSLGAYKKGSDPRLDRALAKIDAIEAFLRQGRHERTPFAETVASLGRLA
jgi:flagellar biosynthesis/type III secretory pathway ATPase